MPSGKKARKLRKKRHNRQLLERSRRSRDEQINEALEETDVVALLPNTSRLQLSLSNSFESQFDTVDNLVSTPYFTPTSNYPFSPLKQPPFISTPKKNVFAFQNFSKTKRSLSSPSTLYLSPVLSTYDDKLSILGSKLNNADSKMNLTIKADTKLNAVVLTHNKSHILTIDGTSIQVCFTFIKRNLVNIRKVFSCIPMFFSKCFSWLSSFFVSESKNSETNKNESNSVTSDFQNEIIANKLEEILKVLSKLDTKQDILLERMNVLESVVKQLKDQPKVTSCAPPLPPPPPPPPPPLPPLVRLQEPLLLTPVSRTPKLQCSNALPVRPCITQQDILSVKLKKTPSVRPKEKTPCVGMPRGPLVSVDMLRAVKLKPSQMRRRSIDRSRHSPRTVFKSTLCSP